MKLITYNGETHTLKEWIKLLKMIEPTPVDDLFDFVKELDFTGRVSNKQLYDIYVFWHGGNPMTRSVFAKRIAMVIKESRKDIRPFRTQTTRGWEKYDV